MRGIKVRFATFGVALLTLLGVSFAGAAPALAINGANCTYQGGSFAGLLFSDLFGFYQGSNPYLTHCRANAGSENVLIADVNWVNTGNNEGFIETNKGVINFQRNRMLGVNNVTVYKIVIY